MADFQHVLFSTHRFMLQETYHWSDSVFQSTDLCWVFHSVFNSPVSTETVILDLNSEMQGDYQELQRTEGKEVALEFLQIL
jgi:hypothetical protein